MNDINAESRESQEILEDENLEKPGALLKAARERKGLSVDEVAKTLYLTRSKLKSLEADDYSKLQSHVFIKGYLRKYAPVVGLDGEKLVEHYQRLTAHIKEPLDQFDEIDEGIPATLVPKFIVPAVLFGVAAVIVISIFIFVGDRGDDKSIAMTPASEIDTDLAERVSANTAKMAKEQQQPNLDRELAVEAQEVVVSPDSITTPQNIGSALTNNRAAIDPSTASAPLLNEERASIEGGNSELRFEFSEDCWLEVRDQFDKIIYTDIAKAGESLELQGEPPFAISLGNAEAVTLFWGDEEINTQPRPGYRTSKIVVGDDGITR